MKNNEQGTDIATAEKYIALISLITRIEDRLRRSDLVYLSLNIFTLSFSIFFTSSLTREIDYFLTPLDITFIFICTVVGMLVNVNWIIFAMRTQLRLKLRYFQARTMERKMNSFSENIFSDEHIFFDPDIYRLDSFDNKEVLLYPSRGLTGMDGFVGSAKPRHLSWILPAIFITIDWSIFFLAITRV